MFDLFCNYILANPKTKCHFLKPKFNFHFLKLEINKFQHIIPNNNFLFILLHKISIIYYLLFIRDSN